MAVECDSQIPDLNEQNWILPIPKGKRNLRGCCIFCRSPGIFSHFPCESYTLQFSHIYLVGSDRLMLHLFGHVPEFEWVF